MHSCDQIALAAAEAALAARLAEDARLRGAELAEKLDAAVSWLQAHHPDKTGGVPPKLLALARPDTGSLGEFELWGRRGNAVRLVDAEWGTLWWCDPEDRPFFGSQVFGYAPARNKSLTNEITYLTEHAPSGA